MRDRGTKFRAWATLQIHCREHEERLDDGSSVDVKVRLTVAGQTQLFVGVYAQDGARLYEAFYDSRPGESMTNALAWGVEQARVFSSGAQGDVCLTNRGVAMRLRPNSR